MRPGPWTGTCGITVMLMLQTSMSQLARLSCTLQDNSRLVHEAGSVADCAPGVITTTAGIVKR